MAEITQAQLAKIIGVSRSAICVNITRGKINKNSAGLIDTQNKQNSDWLTTKGFSEQKIISTLNEIQIKQKNKQKLKPMSNPNSRIREELKENPNVVEPENLETIQKYIEKKTTFESSKEEILKSEFENLTGLASKMMNMSMKDLVFRYGGQLQLDGYSKILQRLMSMALQDQKMQERRLDLVEKDFMISSVFSYLNILSDALFDLAESQNKIIIATVKSDPEKAEIVIRDMRLKSYSKIIKEAKRSINNSIKQLKSKYDRDEKTA